MQISSNNDTFSPLNINIILESQEEVNAVRTLTAYTGSVTALVSTLNSNEGIIIAALLRALSNEVN